MQPRLYSRIVASLRRTPLAAVALTAYAAASSSMVFPEDYDVVSRTVPWFVSFFNGFDVALILCLGLSIARYRLVPSRTGTLFLITGFFAIVASLLASAALPSGALIDALVHFVRFAVVFCFASGSTRRFGSHQCESLFLLLYAVLCASAIVVYQLAFENSMGRIYAAGMGVGSFAQVSAIAFIIALVRRQYLVLAISSIFLVLTFSVTSTVMLILIVACIPLLKRDDDATAAISKPSILPLQQIAVVGTLIVGVAIAASFALSGVGFNVGYNLKAEDAADGHGRKEIWLFALRLLQSGHVGPFGIGFFRTTGCFQDDQLLGRYADGSVGNVHFHSIVFEGLIGLGVLCLPLFWMYFRRIWFAYGSKQFLPCAIFLFFLLTQGVDFTMYRPKELIVWAFLLGMADGQFIEEVKKAGKRSASASGRLVPAPHFSTNPLAVHHRPDKVIESSL